MRIGYLSRVQYALWGSILLHAGGLLSLGILSGLFDIRPAEISWAEGTSTIEVSVLSEKNFSNLSKPSRSIPAQESKSKSETIVEQPIHHDPVPVVHHEKSSVEIPAPSHPSSAPSTPAPEEKNLDEEPAKTTPAITVEDKRSPSKEVKASTAQAPLSNQGSPSIDQSVIVSSPIPSYPESARQAGIEGVVTLRAHINKEGRVTDIFVSKSSGYGEFDEAALKTVKNRWRFKPASRLGTPVESDKDVKVRFVLK